MKKFRGKRKYFQRLWSRVDAFTIDVDDESWFDFWHIHLDFFGLGNRSAKVRREHIKAHLTLYENVLNQLKDFSGPYQSWICIHDEDSGADAVYIHTANPSHDDFPFHPNNVDWDCHVPGTIKDLIDTSQYDIGYFQSNLEQVYFIQFKGNGVPIRL